MTKNTVVATGKGKAINATITSATLKGAINTPKLNNEASAAVAIANLAKQAVMPEPGITPLGHKANSQGGLCDLAIIQGRCNTAFELLDYVAQQRQVSIVAKLWQQYNDHATVISHLARRLKNHVGWCGNPNNMAHGGFISRLQKTGLATSKGDANHLLIAKHFETIAKGLPLYTSTDKVRLAMAKRAAK